jgi:hypothetical protein
MKEMFLKEINDITNIIKEEEFDNGFLMIITLFVFNI